MTTQSQQQTCPRCGKQRVVMVSVLLDGTMPNVTELLSRGTFLPCFLGGHVWQSARTNK